MFPLPFKCPLIQGAAEADAEVVPNQVAKDGKHEVVFPIGVPDEGTFGWLDEFLAKNPKYVELSDRKLVDWAVKSGFSRPLARKSNDKPEPSFGAPALDSLSARSVIRTMAPLAPRDYVMMEVQGNLIKSE